MGLGLGYGRARVRGKVTVVPSGRRRTRFGNAVTKPVVAFLQIFQVTRFRVAGVFADGETTAEETT